MDADIPCGPSSSQETGGPMASANAIAPGLDRRRAILRFIAKCKTENGVAPTVSEIADGVGLASKHSVRLQLATLEAQGLIETTKGIHRSIRITYKGAMNVSIDRASQHLPDKLPSDPSRPKIPPTGIISDLREPRYLSVKQFVEYAPIFTERVVRQRIMRKKFPGAVRMGGRIFIDVAAWEASLMPLTEDTPPADPVVVHLVRDQAPRVATRRSSQDSARSGGRKGARGPRPRHGYDAR